MSKVEWMFNILLQDSKRIYVWGFRFLFCLQAYPAGQERKKPIVTILDLQSVEDFMIWFSFEFCCLYGNYCLNLIGLFYEMIGLFSSKRNKKKMKWEWDWLDLDHRRCFKTFLWWFIWFVFLFARDWKFSRLE